MTAQIRGIFKLAVILFILLSSSRVFSQKYIDVDSLKIGTSYKVILFDDREVTGKLLSTDSVYIRISEKKNIFKIRKDDILRISTDIRKSVNDYLLSFYSGYSFAPGNYYNNSYGKKISLNGFNAGADIVLPLVNSRGVRICLSYNRLIKPEYTDDIQLAIYPSPGYNKYEESTLSLISFRTEYLLGNISPYNKFYYFFSGGPGFCYFNESAYKSYYIQNDTVKNINYHSTNSCFSIILAVGISAGYKIKTNLFLQAQVEYNIFFYHRVNERIRNGLLPVKLGISYFF